MSSPHNELQVPSSITAEQATDQLWKFQLRREHAAILERQEALIKQLNKHMAESTVKDKQHDDESKACSQQIEKLLNEVSRMSSDYTQLAQENFQLKGQLEDIQRRIRAGRNDGGGQKATMSTTSGFTPPRRSQPQGRSQPQDDVCTSIPSSSQNSNIKAHIGHSQLDQQAASQPEPEFGVKKSEMKQSSLSMHEYVIAADKLASTVSKENQEDFAADFIRGLDRSEDHEAIVKALYDSGNTRTTDSGHIDIACGWSEFKVVLRQLGLVDSRSSTDRRASKKKFVSTVPGGVAMKNRV